MSALDHDAVEGGHLLVTVVSFNGFLVDSICVVKLLSDQGADVTVHDEKFCVKALLLFQFHFDVLLLVVELFIKTLR